MCLALGLNIPKRTQKYRYALYVTILWADYFQFPCGVIFKGFLAEDEQRPKLVSANPPNIQTIFGMNIDYSFKTVFRCLGRFEIGHYFLGELVPTINKKIG